MAKRKRKLFDIDVMEVSLVDRAANRRKFMFRKSHQPPRGFVLVEENYEGPPEAIAAAVVAEALESTEDDVEDD